MLILLLSILLELGIEEFKGSQVQQLKVSKELVEEMELQELVFKELMVLKVFKELQALVLKVLREEQVLKVFKVLQQVLQPTYLEDLLPTMQKQSTQLEILELLQQLTWQMETL